MDAFDAASLPMWTADGHGAVRIRMGTSGIAAAQPRTVMDVVEETCKAVPDHNALAVETQPGTWTFTTYKVDGKNYLALNNQGIFGEHLHSCKSPHSSWPEAPPRCLHLGIQLTRMADHRPCRHICWV